MGKEREGAGDFARALAGAYGAAPASGAPYGSAAAGRDAEGAAAITQVAAVRATAAATLRRGSALARAWATAKTPPPLVMQEQEFRDSTDVFPMELADIRDAHLVLHGADPFAGVEIRPADLRLQLERELKSA